MAVTGSVSNIKYSLYLASGSQIATPCSHDQGLHATRVEHRGVKINLSYDLYVNVHTCKYTYVNVHVNVDINVHMHALVRKHMHVANMSTCIGSRMYSCHVYM